MGIPNARRDHEGSAGGGGRAQPLDDDLARKLDGLVRREQAESRLSSLAVAVTWDGLAVWWAGHGSTGLSDGAPPGPGTQYRVGSISKTFVAVEVMRLRDEGALELNDFIGSHVPELGDLPVTLGQLLSHTSGLRSETAGPWWERTPGTDFSSLRATSLRPVDLLSRPGRRFHYSNPGYAVLGELVARKRRSSFRDALEQQLWRPLGMARTSLRPVAPYARGLAVHPHADVVMAEPEHDAVSMAPAGQLWSTLEDLACWSSVLAGHRPEVLAAATAAEMAEPVALADAPDQPWTAAYGLGLQLWNHGGRRAYGHSGSMPGFIAMLMLDQDGHHGLVTFTNTTRGLRPGFCDEVLDAFRVGHSAAAVPFRPSTEGLAEDALDLVGTWYWGPAQYTLALGGDGRLVLNAAGQGRDGSFRPAGAGTYRGEWGYFAGETLVPKRDGNGRLTHLDIGSFVFSRAPYDRDADIPGGVDEKGWGA